MLHRIVLKNVKQYISGNLVFLFLLTKLEVLDGLKALPDALPCAEDIDLHLFLADVEDGRNVLVCFSFDVAQLHAGTLFLRQMVDNLPYRCHTIMNHGIVER